jgi:hypothetical protein
MKRVIIASIFSLGLLLLVAGTMSAQASVAGEWDASMNTPGGARPFKLIFKVDGEKLTGTAKRSNGDVPIDGTIKGSDISFSYTIIYNDHDLQLSFTGKVTGDNISGTVSFGGQGEDEWGAKRTPPPVKPKP